ncbi:polar amino acid transport system permease protein [Streptosporangium becharense]|uniref:Polar amino acid transport system permease protein n=1 Tax=Streptosporangium becharense TaxID=1816182 RepID=A0A7W9IMC0_9ACTN|nr:amino acid ABC transporter permease [Streptosporangium becharense]MBB2910223.1 polar amino acid transport system permease protein [Streptosporangium becharense]MBB5822966.1 polar amino acid transport system permease protein [Streptosporangium becharense]
MEVTKTPGAVEAPELPIDAVRPPRPGRWAAALLAGFALVWLAYTIIVNENLHWDVIVEYLGDGRIMGGLWVTIQLTVLSMAIGLALGIVTAVMQLSDSPVLRGTAALYTWFFRGTPLLVQLIFWFNIGLVFPSFGIGIPFDGPKLVEWQANELITPFTAALLGLAINEGAYMAEIVRAGIRSVDPGQREAAESLGMSHRQVLRRVVLPQAMRVIIPPTGNQFISMLKTTSMVSVIAGAELLTVAQRIYLGNFEVIALLIVASVWYIVLTTIASVAQHFIEKRFERGHHALPARVRRNLRPFGGRGVR